MNKQNFFFILVVFIAFNYQARAMNPVVSKLKVKVNETGVFYAPLSPGENKERIYLPLGRNSLCLIKALEASPVSEKDKKKFFKAEWPAFAEKSESPKKKKPRDQ